MFNDLGRKFIFALILTVCATGYVVLGKMSVNDWISFEEVLGGLYVIGNVGDKIAGSLATKS